jgi:hypothetical protein
MNGIPKKIPTAYFQNQCLKPVTVHLRLSGFYELVPTGENGNLAGIEPIKKSGT